MERSELVNCDGEQLAAMGFGTKVNIAYYFEDIDLCQCKPVNTVNGWLMVRSPQRVIERSTVCIDHNYAKDVDLFKRWLHTVGICEQTNSNGVPILSSFCKFLIRQHTKQISINDDTSRRTIAGKYNDEITDVARASFYNAYHISPTQQKHWESVFDSISVVSPKLIQRCFPSVNTSSVQLS